VSLDGVADQYGLDAATANECLGVLKKQGWIEAFRSDGVKGWAYRRTDEGRRVYDEARKMAGVG
jgi:hypothetical protein